MLDKIESETQSESENLSEDSDREYIAEEPNPENKGESHQLLTTEETVDADGEVLYIDNPPAEKLKRKVTELKWKPISKLFRAKKCTQKTNVLLDIPEYTNPFLIFEETRKLNEIVKHICDQRNLYAIQNVGEFPTNSEEIRTFLGINNIMSITKLSNVKCYWSVISYLFNIGGRNTMTRNCFLSFLKNLNITDNQMACKSDKVYKMRIVINHLNKAFQDAMSDAER